jgi:hypothetical protein
MKIADSIRVIPDGRGVPGAKLDTPRSWAFRQDRKEGRMFWTIAVVLIALWMLGLVTSYTMGGFIHILIVVAVVAVLVRIIQGRRAL